MTLLKSRPTCSQVPYTASTATRWSAIVPRPLCRHTKLWAGSDAQQVLRKTWGFSSPALRCRAYGPCGLPGTPDTPSSSTPVFFHAGNPSVGRAVSRQPTCHVTPQGQPHPRVGPSQAAFDPSAQVHKGPAISAQMGTTPRVTPALQLLGGWLRLQGSSLPPAQSPPPPTVLLPGRPNKRP